MAFVLAVTCTNHDCPANRQPILLPAPIPEEIIEDHSSKPIPDFALIVACSACGLVSGHTRSASHIREVPQEGPGLTRLRIACTETMCDEENCGVRVRVHMQLAKGKSVEMLRDKVPGWNFSPTAKCANGHVLRKKSAASYSFHLVPQIDFPALD